MPLWRSPATKVVVFQCPQGAFATRRCVWMRDLLGMSDKLEGIWQCAWNGWLRVPVGELRLGLNPASHNLIRRSPLQHALSSQVVGLVEALEQRLQVTDGYRS
jgi:hypothetical protein